ncbi:MAG: SDR family oxidoreductase [Lactobacillaceae bacterium]|jgi:nucleoside-diphosphate-sugar epimerase|nr:SDR family oxidoreductase [Lactobacillaceae bacterium]
MRILVAGASGRVGTMLTNKLAALGHEVFAGTRHVDDLFDEGVQIVDLDLTLSQTEINKLIDSLNLDAIYFTAGSRGKNLLAVDAFGAVKLINAAEVYDIKRFIMLSALNATQPDLWTGELNDYYIAKFFADKWLMDEVDLNYTILQPAGITDEEETDLVSLGQTTSKNNSAANIAETLSKLLEAPNAIKKVIKMSDGITPVEQAISNLV